jgi:hypothetical protein
MKLLGKDRRFSTAVFSKLALISQYCESTRDSTSFLDATKVPHAADTVNAMS